jgi:DNA-binding CsgD family transcriptional regulator
VLTVETHRKRLLEKLGLRGTPEAVLYALSKGLIGPIK